MADFVAKASTFAKALADKPADLSGPSLGMTKMQNPVSS